MASAPAVEVLERALVAAEAAGLPQHALAVQTRALVQVRLCEPGRCPLAHANAC